MVVDDNIRTDDEGYELQEDTVSDDSYPEIPSGLENKLEGEDRSLSEVFEDIADKASRTLGRKKELEMPTYRSKKDRDYFEPRKF